MTEVDNDESEHDTDSNEQSVWDITPFKTKIELSEGNIQMKESAVYNGRLRVAQAVDAQIGKTECAWLYIQAESRDGADVKLTPDQAIELRDALDKCIERSNETDTSQEEI